MTLIFRAPDGLQTMGSDALAEAVRRIETGGAEFWSIGSGDAALWAGNPYNPTQFEFYFDGADRFLLRFYEPGAETLTAQDPNQEGQTAIILVGGNPMPLYGKSLVDRATAVRAAEHFALSCQPDPLLVWR